MIPYLVHFTNFTTIMTVAAGTMTVVAGNVQMQTLLPMIGGNDFETFTVNVNDLTPIGDEEGEISASDALDECTFNDTEDPEFIHENWLPYCGVSYVEHIPAAAAKKDHQEHKVDLKERMSSALHRSIMPGQATEDDEQLKQRILQAQQPPTSGSDERADDDGPAQDAAAQAQTPGLPPGYTEEVRVAPSRSYPIYRAPDGTLLRSKKEAWRHYGGMARPPAGRAKAKQPVKPREEDVQAVINLSIEEMNSNGAGTSHTPPGGSNLVEVEEVEVECETLDEEVEEAEGAEYDDDQEAAGPEVPPEVAVPSSDANGESSGLASPHALNTACASGGGEGGAQTDAPTLAAASTLPMATAAGASSTATTASPVLAVRVPTRATVVLSAGAVAGSGGANTGGGTSHEDVMTGSNGAGPSGDGPGPDENDYSGLKAELAALGAAAEVLKQKIRERKKRKREEAEAAAAAAAAAGAKATAAAAAAAAAKAAADQVRAQISDDSEEEDTA